MDQERVKQNPRQRELGTIVISKIQKKNYESLCTMKSELLTDTALSAFSISMHTNTDSERV